jgi:hypothetical protein
MRDTKKNTRYSKSSKSSKSSKRSKRKQIVRQHGGLGLDFDFTNVKGLLGEIKNPFNNLKNDIGNKIINLKTTITNKITATQNNIKSAREKLQLNIKHKLNCLNSTTGGKSRKSQTRRRR